MLFEDWQSDTAALSNINHVNPNSQFQEHILKTRLGRKRLHYWQKADIDQIFKYFNDARTQ